MNDILLGIVLFTLIVMVLALTVMAARALLVRAVAVSVTVNSDKALPALTGQKLLEVLQDNRILIPSACAGAGTCGLCRIHVTGGGGACLPTELAKLDKVEVQAGLRLACQVVLRGDMSIEVADDLLGLETWQCRVASARWLTPFIRELVLKLPEGVAPNLRAGAFVQVTVPPHQLAFSDFDSPGIYDHIWAQPDLRRMTSRCNTPVTRAYSIANRPEDQGAIVLNVRLALPPPATGEAPPGVVSSYLFGLSPGETVDVSGPYGSFGATENDREMILIGGGVGMAPLRAIIFDQLKRTGTNRRISYWYGARSRIELFYEDEFDQLAVKHPNFNWTVALSDPKPEDDWRGPAGFVHDVALEKYLKNHPAPEDCEYYLCGPPLMIKAVMSMLKDIGVDRSSIFNDDFGS